MAQGAFVPTLQIQAEPVLGARLVGLEDLEQESELVVAERVAEGLDPHVVDRLAEGLVVPRNALLEAVGLAVGVYRYRRAEGLPLERGVSDRLYRVARAGAAAVDFFESDTAAVGRWLLNPKFGLGGRIPLTMACTPEGSDCVVELLLRMAYGIIS